MSEQDLVIEPGLPFSKVFSVTFPSARNWMLALGDFEVTMDVREGHKRTSQLIVSLMPYLTTTMPTANTVVMTLSMTGEQTASIPRGGYYRLNISTPGPQDPRSYDLVEAVLRRDRS